MEAIPRQIGSSIEPGRFRFGSKVQTVREGGVTLETGEELSCHKVVLAVELRPGIFVCGEYGSLPSIQWALLSGRLAAEAILAALPQRKNP
jgi:hypothetical protein